MRFYRRQTSSVKPQDTTFAVEADGRIVTKTKVGMEMPSGEQLDRYTTPKNGTIRYNQDVGPGGELEAYVNGTWEIIKTNRQATVTRQTFNNGDYADTIFGPLAYDIDITRPENVMVYVDNVYQVPGVNYELKESIAGLPITTATTIAISANFGDTTIFLESIADFNAGRVLSGTNLEGNIIIATSATTNSITISPGAAGFIPVGGLAVVNISTGTYVVFTEDAIPTPSKPVTTLLGLDGYCPPFITE
jgi:hypothetical protein